MDSIWTGTLISALRREHGLTQKELASLLGVSDKAVSKWERGECFPDITLIPPLATCLGVSADELLAGERAEGRAAAPEAEGASPARRADPQLAALTLRHLAGVLAARKEPNSLCGQPAGTFSPAPPLGDTQPES